MGQSRGNGRSVSTHFGALLRRLRSRCVCVGAEEQGPSRWARFTKPGHHSKARQSTQEGKGHKRADKQTSPPQFVSLSWRLRCHSVTPSRALLPTDLVPLLRLSLFMSCPSLCACVYSQSPCRTTSAPSKKPRHTKTSRRRRSRHADAPDTGRTHAPKQHRQGKARQTSRQGEDPSWMLPSKSHSHWLTACQTLTALLAPPSPFHPLTLD
ncbi:hypothetical protein BKA56DRAFT_603235 [Ilyonectria sp. MPI-CAGE-AT-0026]|nr:hypothetical protein BKA56DRAFT_603235 [Ilyonectria sp. MPI-CAGE-AT-0026]